jgi:hypothetical protein
MDYVFSAFKSARGLEFKQIFRVLINMTSAPSKATSEAIVEDQTIWKQILWWLLMTPDAEIFADVQLLCSNIVRDIPIHHPSIVEFTNKLYDLHERVSKFNAWIDFDDILSVIMPHKLLEIKKPYGETGLIPPAILSFIVRRV